MENEFVPYEQALKLKELGFNEPCLASWTYKTKSRIPTLIGCGALLFDVDGLITNETEDIICSAPLYQQVFSWALDKYSINSQIAFCTYAIASCNTWSYTFDNPTARQHWQGSNLSYEDSRLDCLKELINKIV